MNGIWDDIVGAFSHTLPAPLQLPAQMIGSYSIAQAKSQINDFLAKAEKFSRDYQTFRAAESRYKQFPAVYEKYKSALSVGATVQDYMTKIMNGLRDAKSWLAENMGITGLAGMGALPAAAPVALVAALGLMAAFSTAFAVYYSRGNDAAQALLQFEAQAVQNASSPEEKQRLIDFFKTANEQFPTIGSSATLDLANIVKWGAIGFVAFMALKMIREQHRGK